MGKRREEQSWRGWLSLILFPAIAALGLWQSLALLWRQREPFTRLGIGIVSPGYLIGIGGVTLFMTIWIALKERAKWPLGFKPGRGKTVGFGMLLLSFVVMTVGFFIAAVGQARLVGW